jgi:hypothetical protein
LQLHSLVYPVVEFHQASSTLDVSLSYRTPYATMRTARLGAYSGDPGSIGAGQSEAKAKGRAKGGVQKRLPWVTILLYPTASEREECMLALCSSGYSQRWHVAGVWPYPDSLCTYHQRGRHQGGHSRRSDRSVFSLSASQHFRYQPGSGYPLGCPDL